MAEMMPTSRDVSLATPKVLWTAQAMGITRGVHTSTMSVHYRERTWYPSEELAAYDTPSVYGLTKGFGEQICQYFARWFDMNLIALRITGPRTREQFLAEREKKQRDPASVPLYLTDEEDLARAYLAALSAVQVGHGRFDAVFIAGDEAESEHNLSKAQRLLGWQPQSQRYLNAPPGVVFAPRRGKLITGLKRRSIHGEAVLAGIVRGGRDCWRGVACDDTDGRADAGRSAPSP